MTSKESSPKAVATSRQTRTKQTFKPLLGPNFAFLHPGKSNHLTPEAGFTIYSSLPRLLSQSAGRCYRLNLPGVRPLPDCSDCTTPEANQPVPKLCCHKRLAKTHGSASIRELGRQDALSRSRDWPRRKQRCVPEHRDVE